MPSWLQLSIETDASKAPLLELLFEALGALSVTLGDAGDQPLLEPKPGEEKLWKNTRVTALFEGTHDTDRLRTKINRALNEEITRNLQVERLEDRAWERVWLDQFRPMKFGRRLWVCPDGQMPNAPEAVVVELDPGLAFGTGTHPTTALCLAWLDGQNLKGKTIIDYGCGSGILAIAALHLGAAAAIAIDYDPQALQATKDNAQKNGVADRLSIHLPEDTPETQADLLIANILAGPLVELAPQLGTLMKPNTPFALSGILEEQAAMVSQAYASFATMDSSQQKEEWMLLRGRKTIA